MNEIPPIQRPDEPAIEQLCQRLVEMGAELDRTDGWPGEQLQLCGQAGVFKWFMPQQWGGGEWGELDVTRGYLRLSAACLTTTFVITQRTGACLRIAGSDNEPLKERLLPDLVSGKAFATVGISHLTTSRRHLRKPALQATETDAGFTLEGFSPWVTGAQHASTVVTGAELEDGRQILIALPTDAPGVTIPSPPRLVGLTGSHTGEVRLDGVQLGREWLLAGPVEDVMKVGAGASTGGLQTSTLAVGLSKAAVEFLEGEAEKRPDLSGPAAELRDELSDVEQLLLSLAGGHEACSKDELRTQANSLVLRASQAALAAAKGSGYVVGHPAGRWCREALFFLVWSCPQGVMAANLCELAGIE
ncbi:MAG: acyl-CoA dehydrogenase [Planctomycetota bacterium]|nr:MAG: acyl-CoA dehydrogenase [Planctomycetota bacterium]